MKSKIKLELNVFRFVEDYVRAARNRRGHCSRREFFIDECQVLSRKLRTELSLEGFNVRLCYGSFQLPTGWLDGPAFAESGQELPVRKWGSHYWLVVEFKRLGRIVRYIVDPTIEQFLRTRMYVRRISDPQYRPSLYC
jgi:hypothetical protein